ncbi:MAG: BNR repeat protein [uncultured bacterium]|nr:MAG: BNR repeat protein [uncultured bacterium]
MAIDPASSIYKVRVNVVNTTISGNQAGIGGGISLGGCGLAANKTTLSIHNATITLNKANSGAGIYFNGSTLSLANSVLAANTDLAPGGGTGGTDPDCGGPSQITSNGYNLLGLKGTCNIKAGTGDLIGMNSALDPGLASLSTNWIHGQKENSQTIDAGNPAGCLDENKTILKIDQRLSPRPIKGIPAPSATCDIGAVEFDPDEDQDKDGFTSLHGDCNDFDASFSPDEFDTCGDGIDTNCDGSDINCQNIDQDGDGFTPIQNDCNDSHAGINPDSSDFCGDHLDANCSGDETDAVDITTYYADNDNDAFGNPYVILKACLQPDHYVTNHSDCDDSQASINPNIQELCGDTIDQDCNGNDLDCSTVDADSDGFTPAAGDCDDSHASIHSNATEICDGIDNNCSGGIDENFGQTTCGVGTCQRTIDNCLNGQVQQCIAGGTSGEICGNNIDEDCDGSDLICETNSETNGTVPEIPAPSDQTSNESSNENSSNQTTADTKTTDTETIDAENTNDSAQDSIENEDPTNTTNSATTSSGGGCSLQM